MTGQAVADGFGDCLRPRGACCKPEHICGEAEHAEFLPRLLSPFTRSFSWPVFLVGEVSDTLMRYRDEV